MPSNVAAAVPVGVMPHGLTTGFQEEIRFEPLVNTYPDGSSDRTSLVTNPRRFFKLTRPLVGAAYTTMFNFYQAHRGVPFYFYNLRETVPQWTTDPTGTSTFGRYVVVFDGAWNEDVLLPRSSASFALREVS